MKLIDLSYKIDPNTPVYPGDGKPTFEALRTIAANGYHLTKITIESHTGTHIDSPAHILENGKFLDDYPLSHFFGSGKVIDCRNVPEIGPELIRKQLGDDLPDFILLYTGTDKYWGKEDYFKTYPLLLEETVKEIARLPLKGIGIDAPSFDAPGNYQYTNHKMLLRKNILLIENICNLGSLVDSEFRLSCFPLNIDHAEGSPARVCAIIEL